MRDLLHMKLHADRLRQLAEGLRADKYTMNPEADFAEMIGAVVQARRLREMAKAIGVSHSHLSSLGKLRRMQPSYSAGVKIILWFRENMGG